MKIRGSSAADGDGGPSVDSIAIGGAGSSSTIYDEMMK